jgi:hypothetical protein
MPSILGSRGSCRNALTSRCDQSREALLTLYQLRLSERIETAGAEHQEDIPA